MSYGLFFQCCKYTINKTNIPVDENKLFVAATKTYCQCEITVLNFANFQLPIIEKKLLAKHQKHSLIFSLASREPKIAEQNLMSLMKKIVFAQVMNTVLIMMCPSLF